MQKPEYRNRLFLKHPKIRYIANKKIGVTLQYHYAIMIKSSVRYSISDRVRDMIEDNNQLLLVLNRFHIPFGFGDRTVGDVCDENGIDTPTFLAVADLISGRRFSADGVKLPTLMAYLREAHSYILDFRLPDIRETLISAVHQPSLEDVAMHIIKFFDEYMEEVRAHMDYEDSVVFPYIEGLLEGNPGDGFHIADFASKHESVVSKLDELKDIFMQHYCMPNTRLLNRALFNISACGDDLVTHCEIENMLLVPAVEALERDTRRAARDGRNRPAGAAGAPGEKLSAREKEIIRLVAHGLANKEIADRLCLSFHTVTTYRKNISSKLNIHSTAALTIYAILQGIADPKDIELK